MEDWKLKALYVHIPFCRKICPFCAFAVRRERASAHAAYIEALLQETQLRAAEFQAHLSPLTSLYFGGGTPSSLLLTEVETLLEAFKVHWGLAPGIEIAFEVNPEDATLDYLQGLKALGITRLSLGAQSFQPHTLQILGRNHSAFQVRQALQVFQQAGFENFNFDLIFGVPGQTLVDFQADLTEALHLCPPHLSLYGLDIEPRTPFAQRPEFLRWMQEQQPLQEAMYLQALEALAQIGLEQYEVSNFAQVGRQGLMNRLVWDGEAYLGVGTGAHSFIPGQRWANRRSLRLYQQALQSGQEPLAFRERLSLTQAANEAFMVALRQPSGLDLKAWQARWGVLWPEANEPWVRRFVAQGWMNWEAPRLQLTPRGMLLADALTAQLMLSEAIGS